MATTSPVGIYYRTQAEARPTDEAMALSLANSVDAAVGLVPITPASVAVGAGSASVGAGGLVTVTAAQTISLNGVFSSAYRNYRIDFGIESSAGGNGSLAARFRNAGVDRSTTDYLTSGVYMYAANSVGAYSATTTFYDVGYSYQSAGSYSTFTLEVMDPAKPGRSKFRSWNVGLNSSGQAASFHTNCLHNLDQSHDGITLLGTGSAPTYTGTIRVYGYR